MSVSMCVRSARGMGRSGRVVCVGVCVCVYKRGLGWVGDVVQRVYGPRFRRTDAGAP